MKSNIEVQKIDMRNIFERYGKSTYFIDIFEKNDFGEWALKDPVWKVEGNGREM